jgi:hypothetical protein
MKCRSTTVPQPLQQEWNPFNSWPYPLTLVLLKLFGGNLSFFGWLLAQSAGAVLLALLCQKQLVLCCYSSLCQMGLYCYSLLSQLVVCCFSLALPADPYKH